MVKDDLILKISDKNVDVDKFAQRIIDDVKLRDEIVYLMLNDPKIMVYYHSYYIIGKASETRPELFYDYWDDFAFLLNHENSYHRDFGLTLIANLTKVDKKNKFKLIFDDYFKHINDVKFMTAQHCIRNTAKVMTNKEDFKEDILKILLDIDNRCDFLPKQKALLKSNIIEIFDEFYEKSEDKERIKEFIKTQASSISPKTNKLAKEFILKHNL
jgi:hypothetical protein